MNNNVLLEINIPGGKLFSRGKARNTFELDNLLLIVATDRISAFDVVLPCGIPDKGRVLNQLSAYWLNWTSLIIKNHMIWPVNSLGMIKPLFPDASVVDLLPLVGRSMLVWKMARINIECVVRGYLAGSAWEDYKKTGAAYGYKLPKGMLESQELPEPLFTPTTKADQGHDMPLTIEQMKELVGSARAEEMKAVSLELYAFARRQAITAGIIIADTKFEYGEDSRKRLVLIDEVLTPDSSRFWQGSLYKRGQSQPSYDKQPVRDWLAKSGWNKEPPAPELPGWLVEQTAERYRKIYTLLTGQTLI
jgi:phosphoribosylaminoimidazole-succinocarboxamide synthase